MPAIYKETALWRWFKDDSADIDTCAALGDVSCPVEVAVPDHVHIRIQVENAGSAMGFLRPELWASQSADFSNEFKVTPTTDLRVASGKPVDDAPVNLNRCTPPAADTFTPGLYSEDNVFGGTVALPTGTTTEFAFCVRGRVAGIGKTFFLRLRKSSGELLDVYDGLPPSISLR